MFLADSLQKTTMRLPILDDDDSLPIQPSTPAEELRGKTAEKALSIIKNPESDQLLTCQRQYRLIVTGYNFLTKFLGFAESNKLFTHSQFHNFSESIAYRNPERRDNFALKGNDLTLENVLRSLSDYKKVNFILKDMIECISKFDNDKLKELKKLDSSEINYIIEMILVMRNLPKGLPEVEKFLQRHDENARLVLSMIPLDLVRPVFKLLIETDFDLDENTSYRKGLLLLHALIRNPYIDLKGIAIKVSGLHTAEDDGEFTLGDYLVRNHCYHFLNNEKDPKACKEHIESIKSLLEKGVNATKMYEFLFWELQDKKGFTKLVETLVTAGYTLAPSQVTAHLKGSFPWIHYKKINTCLKVFRVEPKQEYQDLLDKILSNCLLTIFTVKQALLILSAGANLVNKDDLKRLHEEFCEFKQDQSSKYFVYFAPLLPNLKTLLKQQIERFYKVDKKRKREQEVRSKIEHEEHKKHEE